MPAMTRRGRRFWTPARTSSRKSAAGGRALAAPCACFDYEGLRVTTILVAVKNPAAGEPIHSLTAPYWRARGTYGGKIV